MNISEEKAYLYSMMRDITAERRELTKIYWELKSRLDDLIKLDIRGLEDTPIAGIVDMHNAKNMKLVTDNIKREAERTIAKVEQEMKPEEKTIIPKAEIEKEKEKVSRQVNNKPETSLERDTGLIVQALKEGGRPMSVKEIYDVVSEKAERHIKERNFRNNILPRARKRNERIVSVGKGIYQYLHN